MPRLAALASLTSGTTIGGGGFYYPLTNTSSDPTNSTWQSTYAPASGYTFVASDGIYTSEPITSMRDMFRDNTTFNDPDIANWNISSVTNHIDTFRGCTSFNQDLSNWTFGVTQVNTMFQGCSSYNNGGVALTWSGTSNWTGISGLFRDASSFNQSINSWSLSSGLTMNSMFQGATNFNQPLNWSNFAPGNLNAMFWNASSFNQDISSWDVSNVTNFELLFYNVTGYNNGGTSLNWTLGSNVNIGSMFRNCLVFNQIPFSNATPTLNKIAYCFSYCSIFNQNISGWNIGSCTDAASAFNGATVFNQDISGWDTSNVTFMNSMFRGAAAFNQDISSWDTSSVLYMSEMFKSANAFNNGDATNIASKPLTWDTSSVLSMANMFEALDGVFNQDISSWNTSSVINMAYMFAYQNSFNNGGVALTTSVDNWNVSIVTSIDSLFRSTPFNQDISNWDTSSCINMSKVFASTTAFNQDISGWTTSIVTNMSEMFVFADAFNQDISGWNVDLVTNATNFSYLAAQRGTSPANWESSEHPSNVGLGNFYST